MNITEENIGAAVRDTRKALGLTQAELAQRARCSQRFVSELERGKTTGEFCRVLAVFDALGISLQATPAQSLGVEKELAILEEELVAPSRRATLHLVDFL